MVLGIIKKKYGRDDLVIATLVASFLFFLIFICLLTPVGDFIVKTPKKTAVDQEARTGRNDKRGIFRLGDLLFTLGSSDEYIDSEIDLEYDKSAVSKLVGTTRGQSVKSEDEFFEGKKARIQDAMLTNASGFSSKKVTGKNGIESFKENLIDAVNNKISRTEDLITNIYFRRFILVPTETQ